MNIRETIETIAKKNADKIFLYLGDQEITYKKFDENINKAANIFLDKGIKKGDHVCFFLPNCPEYIYGWFGLAKIGAILVPLNTAYRTEETRYIVNHSEANSILFHASLKHVIDRIKPETPRLKNFLSLGEDIKDIDYIPFEKELINASPELDPIDICEEDICEIMYTSGTTGPSKGAMMTHKYWILTGSAFAHCLGLTHEDRVFTCLPFFHANAKGYSTMGALLSEASLIVVERFSASKFWEQIRHYNATEFNYMGAMLSILSKQPESEKDRDHNVRVAYGSIAFDKKDQEYFERRYGITLISGYGEKQVTILIHPTIIPGMKPTVPDYFFR
ncbi:AMP-binding protein [Thermodesulfobacteriota bacterium]